MGYLTDAIAEMQDYGFTDTLSARLTSDINDAMWRICAREPWNFLEATMSLTFTAGNAAPTNWPSDFSKALHFVIPNVGRIRPVRREMILDRYHSNLTDRGVPYYYYFIGTQLYVHPVPETDYTATFDYLKKPSALVESSNEDPPIPERHRRVITLRALVDGFFRNDDSELARDIRREADDRYMDMREDCLRNAYDEPDYIVVTEDDWDYWG